MHYAAGNDTAGPFPQTRVKDSSDEGEKSLPQAEQSWHLWAQTLWKLYDAENDQREWSNEYLAAMHRTSQEGSLGAIPLIVLTRAEGGYGNDLDVAPAELERDRQEGQARLTRLSRNGKQIVLRSGHNMHLEAPDAVADAILEVLEAVRQRRSLNPGGR